MRRPFPDAPPSKIIEYSWIGFPSLRSTWPFVAWYVFQYGLGFEIKLIGRGYIGNEHILALHRNAFGQFMLSHTAPDVRSPITIPKSVAEELVTLQSISNDSLPGI
jgi:hypothetical protein